MALTKVTGTGLGLITGDIATSTAGTSNFRAGVNAGDAIASGGNFNVVVGDEAGTAISTGDNNTFVGYRAGTAVNTSVKNVAVGMDSMLTNTTGDNNVAVGREALKRLTTTNNNVAVGSESLKETITGTENVAVGHTAGQYATTADGSTFIGFQAGQGITGVKLTGNVNTAVGSSAGLRLQGTADENVMVGSLAGQNVTTGSGNVCIGHSAETSSATSTNQIIMGESVTGVGNNNFTFGFGSSDSNIDFGETSITAPSDQRYKEDITTATAGLSFIKDLRPVTFKWKKEKDLPTNHRAYVEGSETRTMNDYTNHGFVAQEVKAAIDAHSEIKDGFGMWKTDEQADGGRQRLGPASLMPVMVKAVQELSTALDAALARIVTLEG